MPFLARLKPLNDRKGHVVRVYMVSGYRFYVDRGWYEVPNALAKELRDLHQDHYDDESPALFDVCTPEEAEKLDQKERAQAETVRSTVAAPVAAVPYRKAVQSTGAMSTADLNPVEPNDDGSDEGRLSEIGRVGSEQPARESARPAAAGAKGGPRTRQRR